MAKKQGKLWGGRFKGKSDPLAEAFTVSTQYESRLVPYDIEGSVAHAKMLGKVGVVSKAESSRLVAGLQGLLREWKAGKWRLDPAFEDVHGNVEARLKARIGALAGKLHSGRSRNDQIALDERLYLRDEVLIFDKALKDAQRALHRLAEKNSGAVMPGYTHLQRAQPVLFAHWCLAYVEMLARDGRRMARVWEELDECPLGAGALAGSSLPLDRAYTARLLGFSRLSENSMDAVSNRDHLIELASALSILMAHLSRLGEDLVLYASQEFGFIRLSDAFSTGSSLMPQKKNPDLAELLRGRAGRVFGTLVHLLTLVKGQPLAYNRDMQEDKEPLFQSIDVSKACLGILPGLLGAVSVDAARMKAACREGFLEATDAAEYLVKKGVPFREAHEAVGAAVRHCLEAGSTLASLSLASWRRFHKAADAGLIAALDLQRVLSSRATYGGTSPARVKAALGRARHRLSR